MKLTRRQLAAALAAGTALAQNPAAPPNPEQELAAARGQVNDMAARLLAVDVPMALEPAFAFKA